MKTDDIVIHAPRIGRGRAGDQLLTLLMWGLYAYLWLPFISLIAWFFGINLFYEEMVLNGGLYALIDLSVWYVVVLFLIVITVIGWSQSNVARFRGKNRRGLRPTVSNAQLAEWFEVPEGDLPVMRDLKRITFDADEQGRLFVVATG